MDLDPKVRDLHNERMVQIGWICHQWSYLEYIVLRILAKLTEVGDDTGKIVFGGLDMRPRLAMAAELAKHLKSPMALRKALAATSEAIDGGLLKRRNRAIHGVQFLYVDGEMRVEMHRGRDRTRRPLSKHDLFDLSRDIHSTAVALATVSNRVLWGDAPGFALLEKPVRQPRKRKPPKPDQKPKPRGPRQKASQG